MNFSDSLTFMVLDLKIGQSDIPISCQPANVSMLEQ